MTDITFLSEDMEFFLSYIEFLNNSKVYIDDFKMNEIREVDINFFKNKIYDLLHSEKQLIFIKNCNFPKIDKKFLKEFLKWKLCKNLNNKAISEWLIPAIGLYKINFENLHALKKTLESEKPEKYRKLVGLYSDTTTTSKDWESEVKKFIEKANEIEEYWNWYSIDKEKSIEIKELESILNSEESSFSFKDFFKNKFKKFKDNSIEILTYYFSKNIESYIKFNKFLFIYKLNLIIKNYKIKKEKIDLDCFSKSEYPKIRKILSYINKISDTDYKDLALVLNFLKKLKKMEKTEEYELDRLFIKCFKFELLLLLNKFNLGEEYLKFNYSLNFENRVFEKHNVEGKNYYILKKKSDDIITGFPLTTKYLYEENGKKVIKTYSSSEGLLGEVYTEEEIMKANMALLIEYNTLN